MAAGAGIWASCASKAPRSAENASGVAERSASSPTKSQSRDSTANLSASKPSPCSSNQTAARFHSERANSGFVLSRRPRRACLTSWCRRYQPAPASMKWLPAASSCRIRQASGFAVRATASGALIWSTMLVASIRVRCSSSKLSISSSTYSPIHALLPSKATAAATGSADPARLSAARLRPEGQPSVMLVKWSTAASGSWSARAANKSPASCLLKARSAARTSPSAPATRNRCSGRVGSCLEIRIRCSPAGG